MNANAREWRAYSRAFASIRGFKKRQVIQTAIRNEKKMHTILTDANFQKEVLESPEPVLVEFGADWCGACDMLAPILERLREEFNGQIKIARLDVDAGERLVKEYGIRDIPTLALFKNGQVVDEIIGVVPRQVIAAKLRALLGKTTRDETI